MSALIIAVALQFSLPPNFVYAIALTENPQLDNMAVNENTNGTYDVGLMQLNTSWFNSPEWHDAEVNLIAACAHIKWLRSTGLGWWNVAAAYNCGRSRVIRKQIPATTLVYANNVWQTWKMLGRDD